MTEHSPTPDEQRIQAALEDLAAGANTEPTRPLDAGPTDAVGAAPRSRRFATLIAAAFMLLCSAAGVGYLVATDDNPEIGTTPPDNAGDRCNSRDARTALRTGMPRVDYTASGSFRSAADEADLVVTGTLARTELGNAIEYEGRIPMVLYFDVLRAPDGTTVPQTTEIALSGDWTNPPAESLRMSTELQGMEVLAFLMEFPEGSGVYNPSPEGLYIACDRDSPAEAVAHSAAGPDDPPNPSLNEILSLVSADAGLPTDECNVDEALDLLRSGLPNYDYQTAGSFAAAAANSNLVVAGTITSAQRVRDEPVIDGDRDVTVLHYQDLRRVDGPAAGEINRIKYATFWPDGAGADPLAEPAELSDLQFVAFLHEAPRVGDEIPEAGLDYQLSVEGLYVACDHDTPAEAVIFSAAGPDDPLNPSLNEIIDIVSEGTTAGTAEVAPPTAEDRATAAAAAVIEWAQRGTRGSNLVLEPPFASDVAIGLGSEINATVPRTDMLIGMGFIDAVAFGRDGPFSAMAYLQTSQSPSVTVGPHDHCASPPLDPPPGVEGLIQVAIQPAEDSIDSCIDWFAVDVYYDADANEIHTVMLSLWEP